MRRPTRHWPIITSARGNRSARAIIGASAYRLKATAPPDSETPMNLPETHPTATRLRPWRWVAVVLGIVLCGGLIYWFYPPPTELPAAGARAEEPREATSEQVHQF